MDRKILTNGKSQAIRFSALEDIGKALECQSGDIMAYIPKEDN